MERDFTNKVVLVTGASAGIGEEIAILFAKYGANLSLVGRNEGNLCQVAITCEKESGLKPLMIVADLATEDGCERTAKETLQHFGRLDVLVNNAATSVRACIERCSMQDFDRVFQLNVRAAVDLTRRLTPALVASRGNVVNVSSVTATMVTVGSLHYSIAKASLDHFTRVVALELAPKGVRVNTVSPGITVSTLVRRVTGCSEDEYKTWLKDATSIIPMGAVCTGAHMAELVTFIASDRCPLVTGAVIPVDGGLSLAGGCGTSALLVKQLKS